MKLKRWMYINDPISPYGWIFFPSFTSFDHSFTMTRHRLSLLCSLLSLPSSRALWVNYTVPAAPTASAVSATQRLVQYVQTEHVNGGSVTLSLLPLLTEDTGVTHIIFAMTHLNPTPGDIHLNDDPPNSTIYTEAWSDAKQLQAAGVKIMITMGGYGDGSYSRLASNVCPIPPSPLVNID